MAIAYAISDKMEADHHPGHNRSEAADQGRQAIAAQSARRCRPPDKRLDEMIEALDEWLNRKRSEGSYPTKIK